ncbi:hypothetical protein SISNIDRAFT_412873 [Sistotremastrum niveocremeum HHB9708]|uniref:Methyltransferase domain-containing protein n=1 Tax=Sistotremastrum niveocremeum HHB9708 TaxID=1314777 RepID=A0A164TL00_9AGAM|nr:hypothetical protein SISNIDRAFT_412873 [Sistotremastrum niveocremeum HHB9708]
MASNPNFPPGLDIAPSLIPGEHQDVWEQQSAIQRFGIAGRIWEAAYLFDEYLEPPEGVEHDPPCSLIKIDGRPKVVIELGSGTGYVGFRLAEQLAKKNHPTSSVAHRLILTDLEDVCPLLEANWIKEREKLKIFEQADHLSVDLAVLPLPWGSYQHASSVYQFLRSPISSYPRTANSPPIFSHIVCSDLVYFPQLLAPLLRSLLHLTSSPFNPEAQVIIAYKIRSLEKENAFWCAFGRWFSFEPVLVRSRESQMWSRLGSENSAFIFIARRKFRSLTWTVPPDDHSLLNNLGDAPVPNDGSDSFETLLLMGLDNIEA